MKTVRKILLALIILTLLFIWGNSLLNREQSSGESAWVMQLVTPFLELFVGKGSVTERLVRKLAHFAEFALLGLELFFWFYGQPDLRLGLDGWRDPFGLSRPSFSYPLLKYLMPGRQVLSFKGTDPSWLGKSFPIEKREGKSIDGTSIHANQTGFDTSVRTAS